MRARIEAGLDALRDRLMANRSAADLAAQIAKKPWAAIGIAAAAGMVLGMTTGRGRGSPVGAEGPRPALLGTIGLVLWRLARSAALDYAAGRAQDWVRGGPVH